MVYSPQRIASFIFQIVIGLRYILLSIVYGWLFRIFKAIVVLSIVSMQVRAPFYQPEKIWARINSSFAYEDC